MRSRNEARRTVASLVILAAAVAALALTPLAQAAFPGANGTILFERQNKLWTINPGGPVNSERKLANLGRSTEGLEYSPNGKKIAFASDLGAGKSWRIVVMKSTGKKPIDVTARARKCLAATAPSWSPNGKKIAFICNDKGFPTSFEVYTINVDGTGLKQITSLDQVEYVKWNPTDPNEIAFVNNQYLYTVPASGGAATLLNGDPPGITGAGWFSFDYSPSGAQIVIESGEGNLHLMDSSTGAFGPSLVAGDDAQIEPAFSPDGGSIAYVNAGSSVFDIQTIPVTGAATGFPLTATPTVSERSPTWRPVR